MATKATATTGSDAPGTILLDTFDALITGAEVLKAQTEVTPEVKAARQARSLVSTLAEVENSASVLDALNAFLSNLAPEVTIDRTEGNALADKVGGLVKAGEYAPVGFDPERAENLLNRWKGVSGRAPRGEGSGDPSQRVPCPVRVVFTYPEGTERVGVLKAGQIQHASTWSSVSAEITKRAMALEGKARGDEYTRPADAANAWKQAVAGIKAGEDGPWSFSQGNLGVEVSAVR